MIIAEIGQNFIGDMELAKELIRKAYGNGADLVKFQLYDSKKIYDGYQETELSKDQAFDFFNYGKKVGIEVFFSVFDVERVKWCEEIGVKRYKIATCRNHQHRLIRSVVATGKEFFISGTSSNRGVVPSNSNAVHLYCIANYPAELRHFRFNQYAFPDEFRGLSDHSIGLDVAKIALSRGAKIIEKHFSVDHKTGVDAKWSMDASELKELKRFETVVREALGS